MTSPISKIAPVVLVLGLGLGAVVLPVSAQNYYPQVVNQQSAHATHDAVVHDAGSRANTPYGATVDAHGNVLYGNSNGNGYGYGNNYYQTAPYPNPGGQYGSGSYGNGHGNGNGYYTNGHYVSSGGQLNNAPYGNAYGYYGNRPAQHNTRATNRHQKHERRDCRRYGECSH